MANEDMGVHAPRSEQRRPRVSAKPGTPNDEDTRLSTQDEHGEHQTAGQAPIGEQPPRRRRRAARPEAAPEQPASARQGRRRRSPERTPERPESGEAVVDQAQPPTSQAIMPEEVIDEAAPSRPRVPVPPEEALTPPQAVSDGPTGAEQPAGAEPPPVARRGRRARDRGMGGPRSNALGLLIEQRFADPRSPVRSYSELERRSGISREALSRYVTPRPDRRRSPTIDTLAAIADAMHISLEQVCRAGVASAQGTMLPPEAEQEARAEVAAPLLATLTGDQFSAVVELLRQMQPRAYLGTEPE